MQKGVAAEASFEALWKLASEAPVEVLEAGEDETVDRAAALGAWIGEIADACLAGGLIAEADHAELQACGKAVTRILRTVSPDALQAQMASLAPEELEPEHPGREDLGSEEPHPLT